MLSYSMYFISMNKIPVNDSFMLDFCDYMSFTYISRPFLFKTQSVITL